MTPEPPRTSQPQLVRAIGRWSMVALALNSILGSGIFGLPSIVAGLLGHASPAAVLIAGAGMAVIIGCYAEVASQFTRSEERRVGEEGRSRWLPDPLKK